MNNIQSSLQQVEQVITAMESVTKSTSMSKRNVEVASRTTVSGNGLAEETITKQTTIVDNLLSAFNQDVERLRMVSKEFEETDRNSARMMI